MAVDGRLLGNKQATVSRAAKGTILRDTHDHWLSFYDPGEER